MKLEGNGWKENQEEAIKLRRSRIKYPDPETNKNKNWFFFKCWYICYFFYFLTLWNYIFLNYEMSHPLSKRQRYYCLWSAVSDCSQTFLSDA
jgi:hypothetical protein